MFHGSLFSSQDSDEPVGAWVFDPSLQRRVFVRLEMAGRNVIAVPHDEQALQEPPLPEQPAATGDPDRRIDARRTPFDPDDFTHRVSA